MNKKTEKSAFYERVAPQEKKMEKCLMLDIGAGTMDILYVDLKSGLHYKAVVKSPVVAIADKIANTAGNLVVTGCEMGGGSVTFALKSRAGKNKIVITEKAAATLHHDMDRVRSMGIRIIDESEAAERIKDKSFSHIVLGDIRPDRIKNIVNSFGVPFEFDVLAVCAQDHGRAPSGTSHLDFRNRLFKQALDRSPDPEALLHDAEKVPEVMNRLSAIAASIKKIPCDQAYIMDSGMAAVLGASMDMQAAEKKNILVLDIATSHTVGAVISDGSVAGFFEYHTKDMDIETLDKLLVDLPNGRLSHRRIVEAGGHGAYIRHAPGFKNVDIIIATGPKRRLVADSSLPVVYGAPFGDNMMTGTVGLLEAVRRKNNLEKIRYL